MPIPAGLIGAWRGLLADIPSGWDLCDGNGGRPNLLGKFLRGIPNGVTDPGSTGGADSHIHTTPSQATHDHGGTTGFGGGHGNHTTPTTTGTHAGSSHGADQRLSTGLTSGNDTTLGGNHNHSWTTLTGYHAHTINANDSSHSHNLESQSILPAYYEVAWIYCDGTPVNFAENIIVLWSGLLVDIPAGFGLDTTLVAKFLRGIPNGSTDPGSTGGSDTHSHTTNSTDDHTHTTPVLDTAHSHTSGSAGSHAHGSESCTSGGVNTGGISNAGSHSHTSSNNVWSHSHTLQTAGAHSHATGSTDGRPPFYELAPIKAGAGGTSLAVGVICAWTGTLANIPEDWALCEGTNSRPNLLGKYIRGINTTETNPGTTGGGISHNHSITTDAGHTHTPDSHGLHTHTAVNGTWSHNHQNVTREQDTSNKMGAGSYGPSHNHGSLSSGGGHSDHSITSQAGHDHGGTSNDDTTMPSYYEVAWIYCTQVTIEASESLGCGFEVRQPASEALPATFTLRKSSLGDLKSGFISRSAASSSLSSGLWVAPANYLGGWNYRKGVMVRASTVGAQANYSIWVRLHSGVGVDGNREVYLEGKAQPDFREIQVTSKDGITLIPHWIDPDSVIPGSSALLWIKHDSIPEPGAPVYIYLGCKSTADASDIEGTFDQFADDFQNNSIDPTKWDMAVHGSGGSYYEQTEELALKSEDNQTGSATAKSKTSFTKGISIEFRARASEEHYYGLVLGKGDYIGEICGGTNWWHTFLEQGYIVCVQDNTDFQYRFAHCPGGVDISENGIDGPDAGSYRYFRVIYKSNGDFRWYWSSDGISWSLLGSGYNEITYLDDAKYLAFYRGGWAGAARGGWLGISWVGVRSYVDPEPYPNTCSDLQENPVQSEPLPGGFSIRHAGARNFGAGFSVVHHVNLDASFQVRHPASIGLMAGFLARNSGSSNLDTGFEIRRSDYRPLPAGAEIRRSDYRLLLAGIRTRRDGAASRRSIFVARRSTYAEFPAGFEIRRGASTRLPSNLVIRRSGYRSLRAHLIARLGDASDLGAGVRIQQGAQRLLLAGFNARRSTSSLLASELLARHRADASLSSSLRLRRGGEEDLPAGFVSRKRRYNRLRGRFTARHLSSIELSAGFQMRAPRSIGLSAEFFIINRGTSELISGLEILHSSSRDLSAGFKGQASRGIPSALSIRRSRGRGFPSQLIVRHRSSMSLRAGFEGQVRLSLPSSFTARHSTRELLSSKFKIRHSASRFFNAGFLPRRSTGIDGPRMAFTIRQRSAGILLSGLTVRHSDFIGLSGRLGVAHWVRLRSAFAVRQPWPYWTDRRYLNGVVILGEVALGDARLEEIILGVMNDVKTWLISHAREEYGAWSDITRTPRAIIRATTYGAVASLYARRIYAPLKKDLVTIPPVSAQILSPEEDAMEYWEGRMEAALENYLRAIGASPLWVSTKDEDAMFTMEDIPLWKEIQSS